MKIAVRILTVILCLTMLLSAFTFFSFAEGEVKQGWSKDAVTDENGDPVLDENGVQVVKERYYVDGVALTGGPHSIGVYQYMFADDGEYIGMYDAYKNVGTPGVMDTDAFKTAVSAKNPVEAITFDAGTKYGTASNKLDTAIPEGGAALKSENSKQFYFSRNFWTVLRRAEYGFIKKNGSTSNLAYEFGHAPDEVFNGMTNSSTHTYSDRSSLVSLYETGFVIDFELMLTELPSANVNILNLSDRKQTADTTETFSGLDTEDILGITKGGFLYSQKKSNALIANLGGGEFVRISVAIDTRNNKFDVYVNGVLMLDDIILYDNSAQELSEFKIEESRMFQINTSTANSVNYALDNFYIYPGTTPVCTATAELKNGIHVEGSYIRNYINGAAIVGNTKLSGEYFGQQINEYITFDSFTGAGFIGNKAHVTRDGVTVSNSIIPSNLFVAPGEVELAGKEFIAWNVTSSGVSRLMAVGEKLRTESNITADAIGIGIAMLNGASLKTQAGSSELRFMAKISKGDYDLLTSLGAKVEPHILIGTTEDFKNVHGYYTPEHFEEIEAQIVDVKAEGWYSQNKSYYYFTGSVGEIDNILTEYSAIAYVKVTLPNGSETLVYTEYSEKNNSRSIHYVADKAYNDRTTKKGVNNYGEKVEFKGDDTYSPYRNGERDLFKGVLDKVAIVNTGIDGVKIGGEYYESPYEFEEMYGALTLGGDYDMSGIVAVIVDGVRLPETDIIRDGSTIKLDVDDGLMFISASGGDSINRWSLLSFPKDKGLFAKSVDLPGKDGSLNLDSPASGIGKVGVWYPISKIDSNGNRTGNDLKLEGASNIVSKKYTSGTSTYYNLSDVQTISFWVYLPSGFEGATFMVLFNSENSQSEGSDYYSYKVNLASSGWNKVNISRSSMGSSRTPLGWDKITSVRFTGTGWEQTNRLDLALYISDIEASNASSGGGTLYLSGLTENGGAAFANKGYASVVDGKHVVFNPKDTTTVSFKEGDTWYLPVNGFAGAKDSDTYYYSKAGIMQFLWDDDEYIFKAGEKKYYKNGDPIALTSAIFKKDGAIYITDKDAMSIFGYTYKYEDQMGLLVLAPNDLGINGKAEQDYIFNAINDLVFVRPSGDTLYEDMEKYSQFKHPYLMISPERWEELEYYYKHDATLRQYLAKIDASYGVGSNKFKAAVNSFSRTDGQRLLSISRDVMEKTINWALLYKLEYKLGDHTEEERQQLLARIWAEVEAACTFYDEEKQENSWNPSHFLDTAELSYPMGIMYDWFYDDWTPAQRTVIAKAIYENALCQTSSLVGKYNYNLGGSTNNWNGVCNGGIMAGALAIVNDAWIIEKGYQENVIKVIGDSVMAVERGMWVYAPDGGYEEGPGYWGYGSTYVQVWVGCVQSACGTNYGIYDAPGYERSCLFTTYLGNGKTTWGFHDGGSGNATPSIASFFSYMSGDGQYSAIKYTALQKGWTTGISMYDIIWYDPHLVDKSIDLVLDSHYSLDSIMTFRSSWDTSNNIFAGLHGGDNQASHGDLDVGNFVIDVNGTYMICDLGADSYNMNGYFGSYRWSYYRKRTEGQNTLVMLNHGETWTGKTGVPQQYILNSKGEIQYGSDGKPLWVAGATPDPNYYGQIKTAISKTIDFKSGATKAYGIVDMTPAYANVKTGTVMKRGLYMTNDRNTVIIQDEGEFKSNQDVWWFAHTQGEITILPNEKSAYIVRNGIYLYAEIIEDPNAPTNAKFTVMAAESLDDMYVGDMVESGIYTGETEGSRSNLTKLTIAVENVSKFNVAVAFTVVESPALIPAMGTLYAWTPIDQWVVD